jgi:NAD(P)-dependent dehydrogenase (short-subunit alcohol dehydrogenase family)
MSKIWFVTGATRGIGAKIVSAALSAGDSVVATGRDPATIRTAFPDAGERLLSVTLDVTNPAQIQAAVDAALDRFGRIDVLVNNAGYGQLGLFEEVGSDDVERQFATNVFGLFNVTRAVLPAMRQQRAGHIFNISSIAGIRGGLGGSIYCASKFAIEGFSESLAQEVEPFGIHVTVVEPGFFRTDFLDDSSLSRTAQEIDDYRETVGKTRAHAADVNHGQRGDPHKLATAFIALVNAKNPPLRLPLGSDTVERIEAKNAHVAEEIAAWRTLATSTDHDQA